MSLSPYGTVAGVQFADLLQWLFTGFEFHVALPAWSAEMLAARAMATANGFMCDCILSFIDPGTQIISETDGARKLSL